MTGSENPLLPQMTQEHYMHGTAGVVVRRTWNVHVSAMQLDNYFSTNKVS